MVGFGRSLNECKSSKVGWEGAYIDYKKLKAILEITDLELLKDHFFREVKLQIEKISLFALKQEGQLADAVGYLRFDSSGAFNPKIGFFGNKFDTCAALGVDLLDLLKFIFVNSIGIRKILKKYNKIFEKADKPHSYIIFDEHVEKLRDPKTLIAIQFSLHAVLEESYSSESNHSKEDKLSYCRFLCIMECVDMVRSQSKILSQPFWDYLSCQSMIFTRYNLGGAGAGGDRVLQWLLKLQPEYFLSVNQSELQYVWIQLAGNKGMPISLVAGSEDTSAYQQQLTTIWEEGTDGSSGTADNGVPRATWGGLSSASMFLNLLSTSLYTINYYIVAPNANHYAKNLKGDGSLGATLIGASSFSALFAAFVYSLWCTRSSFRSALVFSALCPLVGNILYSLAISYHSMAMAVLGRFLCGFGSAEVLNRQLISTCVDFNGMTKACAMFVAAGALGMSIGPLLAAILDVMSGRDMNIDLKLSFMPAGGIIYNHITAPGFLMSALWLLQLLGLIVLFQEPERINVTNTTTKSESRNTGGGDDVSDCDDETQAMLSPLNVKDEYGTTVTISQQENGLQHNAWQEIIITKSLIFENSGLPLTLFLFGYIEMVCEVMISSCSMVTHRYFGWHGSAAGFLIASLGACVLPADFLLEKATKVHSERKILIRAMVAMTICFLGILNYSSLRYDIIGLVTNESQPKALGKQELSPAFSEYGEVMYDWGYGCYFYIFFISFLFMSTIILEGVDTSIMAKVTPLALNHRFVNSGLLSTLIGTVGRIIADAVITSTALLDVYDFVDFVNSAFVPLLVFTLIGLQLVKKYYGSLF